MALIDEISKNKNNDEAHAGVKCRVCKSVMNKINVEIEICEQCFNKQVNEALEKIDKNIYQIQEDIKNTSNTINQIETELTKITNLILKNKMEIDLLNGKAILMKLKIDLDLNMVAYLVNQRQANDFRKESGWELFDINNKYNVEQ